MILRPPRSTLFPTRRSSDLGGGEGQVAVSSARRNPGPAAGGYARSRAVRSNCAARSEEHTSELQSRFDLVCRLLLEKKNKTPDTFAIDHTPYPDAASQWARH